MKKRMKSVFCVLYLLFSSNQTESSLEQLTQGLASLDISQTSANHTTPVGGARPKVRLALDKVTGEGEVKTESSEVTPEQSQSEGSTLLQTQVSRKSDGFCRVEIEGVFYCILLMMQYTVCTTYVLHTAHYCL